MNNAVHKNLQDIPLENQKAYVLERFGVYHKIQENITQKLAEQKNLVLREYKENIRNLAIISGALATFSLTLLNNFYSLPLIIGISLLLVHVMYTFAYLMGMDSRDSQKLLSLKQAALPSIQDITKASVDFLQGNITFTQWFAKEVELKRPGGNYNQTVEKINHLDKDSNMLDYKGDAILIIFILAVSFIVFSFLYPNLQPLLSEFIFDTYYSE